MNEKTYRQCFMSQAYFDQHQERINKRIQQFSNAFFNNAKWKRVFLTICANTEVIKHCEISDFFSDCIVDLNFKKKSINFEDYLHLDYIDPFITTADGPISYREIEYLAFNKSWNGEYVGALVKRKQITQDTNSIKEIISAIGQFEWEEDENALRLMAYR